MKKIKFEIELIEDNEQITIINHNGLDYKTFDLVDNTQLSIVKCCWSCGKKSTMPVVALWRNGDYIEPDMPCKHCDEINWVKKMI